MPTGQPPNLPPSAVEDDPPPVFSSWPRLYMAVLAYLALVILLFYLFTRTFTL